MPDSTPAVDLPIVEPAFHAWPWLIIYLIGSVFLIVAIGLVMHSLMPDDPMPLYFAGGVAAFAIVLPMFLLRLIRNVSIAVDDSDLVVRTGTGRRRLALAHLREHGLSIIDLSQHPELRTDGKRWSATMPGLTSGLFRLRNGEHALLVVSDPRRVCRLRSDADGLTLLLSLKQPEKLRLMIEQ